MDIAQKLTQAHHLPYWKIIQNITFNSEDENLYYKGEKLKFNSWAEGNELFVKDIKNINGDHTELVNGVILEFEGRDNGSTPIKD